MENSNLICKNLVKKYKNKVAIDNINITFEKGKIYGLIGRNGAGKTTLLSMMSAQSPATNGEVLLDGENVWENQKALDRICFARELNTTIGNNANTMKVKQYLKMASIYFPNWDKEMEAQLVNEFNLDVKQRISRLSKGMLSMVTIIVALASKAEFTFLDEPVAGLDVMAREEFYRLLIDEYSATGRTFIISTHIIDEAADLFEEVVMISDGKLQLMENTQELINKAYFVSGKSEDVDNAVWGLEKHHEKLIGRSKSVTVLLHEGQSIKEGYDVTVQKVSLQNLFVSLCGKEGMSNEFTNI